jgi:hypothetical protein
VTDLERLLEHYTAQAKASEDGRDRYLWEALRDELDAYLRRDENTAAGMDSLFDTEVSP